MSQSLALLLWVAIAWGLFALFAALAELYDRSGWRLPAGAEDANLPRRFRLGIALGAGACLACAVAVVVQTDRPLLMAGMVVQGALMAAAGVTDLHKYRLPLPVTVGGIVMACVVAAVAAMPVGWLALGAVWSSVLIIAHMRMTGGAMGWGDHLALLWIGLAAPMVGVFAVLTGHCITLLCAKLSGWGHRPVPIGGAWLLAGAVLFALPSAFLNGTQAVRAPAQTRAAAIAIQPAAVAVTRSMRLRVLSSVLREAGFVTAKVAFAKDRAERERAARAASIRVMELARAAARAEDPGELRASRLLNDLARALGRYDLAGVDALSQQRAELLQLLSVGLDPRARAGREMARP